MDDAHLISILILLIDTGVKCAILIYAICACLNILLIKFNNSLIIKLKKINQLILLNIIIIYLANMAYLIYNI